MDRVSSRLDRIYDELYAVGGSREHDDHYRPPLFLPPGRELAHWRQRAQEILAATATDVRDSRPGVGSYDRVLDAVGKETPQRIAQSKARSSCPSWHGPR